MKLTVVTMKSTRKPGDPKRIGQVRNGYGMVTAKVMCKEGDPMIWTSDALASEFEQAGFEVQRVEDEKQATTPIVITGDQYGHVVEQSAAVAGTVSPGIS